MIVVVTILTIVTGVTVAIILLKAPPPDLRSCLQLGDKERPRFGDGNAWSVCSQVPIPRRADVARRSALRSFLQARTAPQNPPLHSAPPALPTHQAVPLRRSVFVTLAPTDGSEKWRGKGSPFRFLLPRILS